MTERRSQSSRSRRRWHVTVQNIGCGDWPAVITRVLILLRSDYRSLHRRAGKKSFRSAVSIDCGSWRHGRVRIASDRADSHARVGAQGDVAAFRKRSYGGISIKNENEISRFDSDLRPPTSATRPDERRPRPSVLSAGHNHTMAAFGAKNEASLDHGHNGKSFGMSQHTARNAALWHMAKILNDPGAMIDRSLFGSGNDA